MDGKKIKAMLGFAVKSSKIVYGADNIESCRKPIYLIIADADISKRTQTALEKTAQSKKAAMLVVAEKLEDMVFKTNCKAVAVLDKNMSDNIIINAGNGGGNLID